MPIPIALLIGIIIGMQIPTPAGSAEAPPAAIAQPGGSPDAAEAAPRKINVERREADDPTAVGDINAPVTIVTYSDFQCGYCAKWANDTLPTIVQQYVDAGKVRIEYRDIMFFGENSRQSAELAVAAGHQGKYQEFHDEIFADGGTAKNADFSEAGIKALAASLGVDHDQLVSDAGSKETSTLVQKNHDEAKELGVTGTPTFLVNGTPLVGAQPLEAFVKVIDDELAG
ncbi:DsbA family protein [Paeniglutamicibacter cryotolerans]|uniref:Protein-disulfide isomerase n=1 Tax=Paeniglutamicibacter cryotolerans TaxID=670079 RepID=A0A839QPT1_9MICC|nr:thioredoxin domain-containing protein [Paeniglutamicibacter cryotolerans]MBB2995252.1 protein-disulfide isomerase [Paeniglutamicibacter cryotolerans]